VPEDVKELTRSLSPEALETLGHIMRDKKAPAAARVSAANAILDRAYGKPQQSLDVTSNQVPDDMTDEELLAVIEETQSDMLVLLNAK
jgi:hypothetical protein